MESRALFAKANRGVSNIFAVNARAVARGRVLRIVVDAAMSNFEAKERRVARYEEGNAARDRFISFAALLPTPGCERVGQSTRNQDKADTRKYADDGR